MSLRHVTILALVALLAAGCGRRQVEVAPVAEQTAAERAAAERAAAERAAADRAAAERTAADREARERETRVVRAMEALTERIHFDYDSERLTSEAQARLRTKAAIMRDNPGVSIRVEGHADERGSTEYNLALGQRRAESVRAFLAGFGIAPERIATVSFGKERPLREGSGEDIWAMNRRAEFNITRGEIVTIPAEVR
jgi:peptidoglycan-associated lipoprotein